MQHVTQTAKNRPKIKKENSEGENSQTLEDEILERTERSESEGLRLAPEPVDRAAVTIDIRPPASSPPPNPGVNHEDLPGAPLEEIRFRLKRHSADMLKNIKLHFVFFDDEGRLYGYR